ncbi:MAG: EVE domain-containing protein [Acidimicrobiia bacterium]|nr:EVE domain-containing protein [Acidimicrobiia bacterium]
MAPSVRYWINTISKAHVDIGVAGGFTQADHGKSTRLKRLSRGDVIIFYSPRTELRAGKPLQSFTALGWVADDEPYQVEMRPDFHPWRRDVTFAKCKEAPIRPLIEDLTFITDKQRWGFPFRRGLFEVSSDDAERIAEAMSVDLSVDG